MFERIFYDVIKYCLTYVKTWLKTKRVIVQTCRFVWVKPSVLECQIFLKTVIREMSGWLFVSRCGSSTWKLGRGIFFMNKYQIFV